MKVGPKFVNRQLIQLTKRELSEMITSKRFWLGFACVIAVLVISGPFGTESAFSFGGRVMYWTVTCLATFFPATVIISAMHFGLRNFGVSPWLISIAGGLVAGPVLGTIVFLINAYVTGTGNDALGLLLRLIGLCTPIAVAVALLTQAATYKPETLENATAADPPRLLQRIKHSLRGEIFSLQAQDHYVEVTTVKGADLVLIRLSDAIAELGGADGRQVHRSWWVSTSAVARISREGHRMDLILQDGRNVPVGRSRQKQVTQWMKALGLA